MTSTKISLAQARQLLEAFYDGQTTAAQEDLLLQFFQSYQPLPDDLCVDRDMFIAMHAAAIATPPSDLEERIIAATCGRHRRRMPWIAAAASVGALIALSFLFLNSGEKNMQADVESAELQTAFVNPLDTLLLEPEPVKPHEPVVKPAYEIHKRNQTQVHTASAKVDTMTADEVGRMIDDMLTKSFNKAGRSVAEARETMHSIETTINKIAK